MPFANCVAVDLQKDVRPDVVADALKLPFEDEVFDFVYCSHLLEHFVWSNGRKLLGEIYRVLDSTGKLFLTVPNIDWAMINLSRGIGEPFKVIYGGQKDNLDIHKTGYTPHLLSRALEAVSFVIDDMALQYYQINAVCRK